MATHIATHFSSPSSHSGTGEKELSGSEVVWEVLESEGVQMVFGQPGAVESVLLNALPRYPRIRPIPFVTEQSAAHAADGYARASQKVGVCVAGPGASASSLFTGVATAYGDSSPLLALTEQVSTKRLGLNNSLEVDMEGLTMSVTKHNYVVRDPSRLAGIVREAVHLATTGRPGPVLIDLPEDVLRARILYSPPEKARLPGYHPTYSVHWRQVRKAAGLLMEAERPVIMAGRGIHLGRAHEELRSLAEKGNIPVVTTLLGVSAFPHSHPLHLGMIGIYGRVEANEALRKADLILVIGTKLADRAIGDKESFGLQAKIIHIDIDPAEIGKSVAAEVPIVGDVKSVLRALTDTISPLQHKVWLAALRDLPLSSPDGRIESNAALRPDEVLEKMKEIVGDDLVVVADVGQNQLWAAKHVPYDIPGSYVTSGGLGTMGFALPAAIGVKLARPEKAVWAVVGDGGFQMTMAEMATLAEQHLPLVVVLLNNNGLGMVRQLQKFQFQSHFFSVELKNPDFVKLAQAYGLRAHRATSLEEADQILRCAKEETHPTLLVFEISREHMVEHGFASAVGQSLS